MSGCESGDVDGDEPAAGVDFVAALGDLKHAGSLLLVTGNVAESVRARQARHLFGDQSVTHERVLVVTDTTHAQASDYLPDGVRFDGSDVHFIDYRVALRSEAFMELETGGEDARPVANGPVDISETIHETIERIRTQHDPLAPGELRVGISTLSVLLDEYGVEATESFVRSIATPIHDVHGMGFCYLPVPADDPAIGSLKPAFDAHIELRIHSDGVDHRWHLLDNDLSSGWMPL